MNPSDMDSGLLAAALVLLVLGYLKLMAHFDTKRFKSGFRPRGDRR